MLKFFTLILIGVGFAVLGEAGVQAPSTSGQAMVAGAVSGPVADDQRPPARGR